MTIIDKSGENSSIVASHADVRGVFSKIGACFSSVWRSIVQCVKSLFSCLSSRGSVNNPQIPQENGSGGSSSAALGGSGSSAALGGSGSSAAPNRPRVPTAPTIPINSQSSGKNSNSPSAASSSSRIGRDLYGPVELFFPRKDSLRESSSAAPSSSASSMTHHVVTGSGNRHGSATSNTDTTIEDSSAGSGYVSGYDLHPNLYKTLNHPENHPEKRSEPSNASSVLTGDQPLEESSLQKIQRITSSHVQDYVNQIMNNEPYNSRQILQCLNPIPYKETYENSIIENLYQVRRYSNINPYINELATSNSNFWVNASQITESMIAIQGPFGDFQGDIFKLALEKNTSCIVCVADVGNKEGFVKKYWPDSNENPLLLPTSKLENNSIKKDGEVKVKAIKETKLELNLENNIKVFVRELQVSSGESDAQSKKIYQIHLVGWPDKNVISKKDSILLTHAIIFLNKRLNNKNTNFDALSKTSPLMTHCSAGVGRTGMVVVLLEMFAKFYKEENQFLSGNNEQQLIECVEWVRDTVATFREKRAGMVQNFMQFDALVEVMKEVFIDNKLNKYSEDINKLENQINALDIE